MSHPSDREALKKLSRVSPRDIVKNSRFFKKADKMSSKILKKIKTIQSKKYESDFDMLRDIVEEVNKYSKKNREIISDALEEWVESFRDEYDKKT